MDNYTKLDKILHRQLLGDNNLSKFLYKRLIKKSKNSKFSNSSKHVFITGLARSGTTALLNKIFSTGEFGSFLYKYMPFILSPSLANIYSKNSNKYKELYLERHHKDGILFSSNSPECLDEPFWIKSSEKNYKSNQLSPYIPRQRDLKTYAYLLNRYAEIQNINKLVIKNNNNHIRIKSLSKFFSKSKFIILFRDPLTHSKSLMQQHQNFCGLQTKYPFILEYMNLIGHREFGKNLVPFVYIKKEKYDIFDFMPQNLEYWLIQWINTHSWFLKLDLNKFPNIKFICYESLCKNEETYRELCTWCSINHTQTGIDFKLPKSKDKYKDLNKLNKIYVLKAKEIYRKLKLKS